MQPFLVTLTLNLVKVFIIGPKALVNS